MYSLPAWLRKIYISCKNPARLAQNWLLENFLQLNVNLRESCKSTYFLKGLYRHRISCKILTRILQKIFYPYLGLGRQFYSVLSNSILPHHGKHLPTSDTIRSSNYVVKILLNPKNTLKLNSANKSKENPKFSCFFPPSFFWELFTKFPHLSCNQPTKVVRKK